MLYVRGNNASCSALGRLSVTSSDTHKHLGPSGADSQVGGFLYVLGPYGSLQQTLLWGWVLLPPPQPPQVFTARGFEAFFSRTGTLSCMVCLAPHLFLLVYPHAKVGPRSTSLHLAARPLHPGFPSPPLLPVWMYVSSLTPWLLDFYRVWFFWLFPGSSGYFLHLNLLLSFFWLCDEAKCIYLCLHLGQKF